MFAAPRPSSARRVITTVVVFAAATLLLAPAAAWAGKGDKNELPTTWERPFDVSPVKDKLLLATDGKGHYFAFLAKKVIQKELPKGYKRGNGNLFYSADGKKFYNNPTGMSARGPTDWTLDFRDPRHPENGQAGTRSYARTKDDGKTLTAYCDKQEAQLTLVAADKAKAILDKAQFFDRLWNRTPVVLARDDRGVYYYVDNALAPKNAKDYRVYRGKRGTMRYAALKDVADDTGGKVFATKRGNLRLIISARDGRAMSAEWIERKKRKKKLTIVPIYGNMPMIFKELGPYLGHRHGTICDDM